MRSQLTWLFWIAWTTAVALALIYLAVRAPIGMPTQFHVDGRA